MSLKNPSPLRLVIVGRPNVGKSTLFNRLLGRKRALVHDFPGVTRDRLEEKAEWWVEGKLYPILLVDTGGLGGDRFAEEITRQVNIALEEADVVLVIFDAQAGLTPHDQEVLKKLKQSGLLDRKDKPVIAVVNKIDHHTHESMVSEFYSAGLDPVVGVSAEHGRGIQDLQEVVIETTGAHSRELSDEDEEVEQVGEEGLLLEDETALDRDPVDFESEEEEVGSRSQYPAPPPPKIAIVGRPNAGKSTLINAILGQERMIASPIAGTTIDAVDSEVEMGGHRFVLIDTAGIRRKSKTEQGVEVLSVIQARKALERCDVAVLLLDGESGITDQDEKIGSLIEEVGCGVILAVNKWDTQKKNPKFTTNMAAEIVRKEMAYLRYAPVLFTSGLKGKGYENLGELVLEILSQRKVKIPTHELTEWIKKESEIHNPMDAKFYMSHQSGRNPPTFVCHVNQPDKVHFSLRRHLVNAMRERWGFMGNPLRLLFVEGKSTRKADPTKARKSMSFAQRGKKKAEKEEKRQRNRRARTS